MHACVCEKINSHKELSYETTFSGSCSAIHMLDATSVFSERERVATAGMHLTAFKQAILTWTSFAKTPYNACNNKY